MAFRIRLSALAAAAAVATALAAAPSATAFAAGGVPSQVVGSDISWPQCPAGRPYDQPYHFGIVGVSGGAPFTRNDCLGYEFPWAAATGVAQLYMNLDYGQSAKGPLQCSSQDAGCMAYNYGFDAAQWAVGSAAWLTAGGSNQVKQWWLDVETENNWSSDQDQNTYVIQGALDYFQFDLGRTAGVYSTSYQWNQIAGSFAPQGVPNWVAGASSLSDPGACNSPIWPGGQVWAIQYLNFDLNLDQDVGC